MVLNSLDLCTGVFTRVKNIDSSEKSVLDYICMTNDLCNMVVLTGLVEDKD